MVSEQFHPRQEVVASDWVGISDPRKIPSRWRSVTADRPSSVSGYGGAPAYRPSSLSGYGGAPVVRPSSLSEQGYPRQQMVWSDWCGWYIPASASARHPWPSRSIASSSSSLSGYGGGPYRQEMGVIGLGSSACKIPSRFQSESALEPHLPRQIPDSSDLRRRRGPAELALAVSGPDRREVKVPHPTPGKIPNPSSDLGKMKEWVVSYEEDATDPTAVWRILHLRPSEEPRKVPDQIQPRKMELETARRVEYPRQSNSNSTQGKQWMGAPEGNFNPPPTGHSAVLSGWGQNQLPPACLVSPNLNHLNPSHGPELAKQCSQYPRELRNQFQFQDQSKQWDPNPNNKRVLSVSTVDDDYSYFNNMKIEQLEQTKVKAYLCSVEYQPRRVPGKEILEQEVYGIDPYTHNLPKEIVPADLDWSIDDKAEEKQGVNESGDEDTINKDIAVKTNFVMASVPDEAKFYLTQLDMVGRNDKWLWSTGLLWKPPPWPDFCAKGCDRVAHFNMKQGTFLYNFDARMLTKGYHCFSRRLMLEYSKFSSLDSDEPFACKLNNPKHRDTYKQVYVHILNYIANLWEKLPKLSMQFVGLFWNLPPWPDLNFCEDNWMANGMEKGAGTAAKKDAYNAVTWQSKIYSQQAKSKPFIEAGVKNETVSAASGTPSTDLIASGNKTHHRRFSPTKSGAGTFEYQNNSTGVATPPLEFCCPIFMKLISESVIIASGQTYGREKLSQFGHVPAANIFSLYDVSNIGHIPLLLWVARATLYDTLRVTVRIAMIGKFQDGTVFLKMVHDEEPFEIKIDEEEVIDGPEKVIRVWDPGTGPKNMKWLSSPLGVVGDIAEMGSDLFGSSEESSCAALVVASISSIGVSRYFTGMCYPLLVSSISIIVCLIATLLATDFLEIKVEKESEPALQKPLIIPTAFMTVGIAIFIWVALPAKFKSVNITIFVIAVSIYVSISVTAMYGLAVAVLDMLSTIATGLAIDAYGSISDKTGGIAERAGMSHRVPENAIGGIYGVLILKKGHKFEEVQRPGTSLYKIKTLMKCVKQLWLPVSHALLEMTISHFPSPSKTQKHRVENLYEGPLVDIYAIAIRKCDSEGPLMLYVFKWIPASDQGRFFAFGHVYSWRVATGMKVLIMGHNYVPGQSKDLYVMSVQHIVIWLGRKLKSVENDPCGNTVTVMGPDQFITKNTTLPNEKEVDACQMKSMKLYVSFAVHVAVQYKVTSDLPKLLVDSKSLAKPVLYTIEESGEPIITEAGELHLDICLKGLLKKFLWRRLILPRNISRIVGPDYQILGSRSILEDKYAVEEEEMSEPSILKQLEKG